MIAFSVVPPVARPLELMVLLPPFNPTGPAMRLCSTGSVVRVEPVGEATGLGIACIFGDLGDSKASSFSEQQVPSPCS